jgi:hypothetical protein
MSQDNFELFREKVNLLLCAPVLFNFDPVSFQLEVDQGLDVIFRYTDGIGGNGRKGLFWRWERPGHVALTGFQPYLIDALPHFKRQAPPPLEDKRRSIADKLQVVINLKYLVAGKVESLIQFFDVTKADDIQLVYIGRSCGISACTWAPNFWLPTTKSAIRLLDYNYYTVDLDLGKMFLNFSFT